MSVSLLLMSKLARMDEVIEFKRTYVPNVDDDKFSKYDRGKLIGAHGIPMSMYITGPTRSCKTTLLHDVLFAKKHPLSIEWSSLSYFNESGKSDLEFLAPYCKPLSKLPSMNMISKSYQTQVEEFPNYSPPHTVYVFDDIPVDRLDIIAQISYLHRAGRHSGVSAITIHQIPFENVLRNVRTNSIIIACCFPMSTRDVRLVTGNKNFGTDQDKGSWRTYVYNKSNRISAIEYHTEEELQEMDTNDVLPRISKKK